MVVWDGRNGAGNEVGSGVYFVKLESPQGIATNDYLLVYYPEVIGTVELPIERSGDTNSMVQVRYLVTGDTATAGQDYSAGSMAAWQTRCCAVPNARCFWFESSRQMCAPRSLAAWERLKPVRFSQPLPFAGQGLYRTAYP